MREKRICVRRECALGTTALAKCCLRKKVHFGYRWCGTCSIRSFSRSFGFNPPLAHSCSNRQSSSGILLFSFTRRPTSGILCSLTRQFPCALFPLASTICTDIWPQTIFSSFHLYETFVLF